MLRARLRSVDAHAQRGALRKERYASVARHADDERSDGARQVRQTRADSAYGVARYAARRADVAMRARAAHTQPLLFRHARPADAF